MESSSWSVKHYESTTYANDSISSISFSIRIQGIEKEAVEIVSEIPRNFLDNGKETCNRFWVHVLSKAKIHSSIQNNIVPNISQKAIELNCSRDRGFLVKLEVEVEEITNSSGEEGCCQISTGVDCLICGEEVSLYNDRALVMTICSQKHTFHEVCFCPWLFPYCPTCGERIVDHDHLNSLVETSNYLRPNKKKTK